MSRLSRQTLRAGIRNLISLMLVLLFALDTLGVIAIPLLERLEHSVHDLRLQLTLPHRPDSRIVIIDIDEKSMAREGHWPWPRNKLAYLVDILFDYYQVKLLGFDVVFAEPDRSAELMLLESLAKGSLAHDQAFNEELARIRDTLDNDLVFARSLRNRPVVLGFGMRFDTLHESGVLPLPPLMANTSKGIRESLYEATSFTGNIRILQTASASSGFFSTPSFDADGILRRIPLLIRYQEGIYESLPLAMFRVLMGNPPLELELQKGYHAKTGGSRLENIHIEGFTLPVDEEGAALIPYRGYFGSFAYYSATDVLNGAVPLDKLQNKIILVGTTATGLMDLRSTPIQNTFPGVEINANMLAGMLDQSFKQRPAYAMTLEFLIITGTGLLLAILLPRCPADRSTWLTVLVMAFIMIGTLEAWQNMNISLDMATPVILVFLIYVNTIFFGFFIESRSRKRLAVLFGQYVPEEWVSEMVNEESDFGIGGETREMTVLFSDVRGFTTIAESLSPDQLSRLMNDFLTPLTEIIHQHKGTIDKYMGDAIMAFWGAPLTNPEHGRHALQAALAMNRKMDEIRADFRARGWPDIHLGIGLNTGLMNVGNMGSQFRMAYTVLGDAVNLGSRLEGLTKYYCVDIIVSESTRQTAPDHVFQELDSVRVKGKNEPVTLYEPLGLASELSPHRLQELALYHQALKRYRERAWNEAQDDFELLMEKYQQRELYRLYLDRIAAFKITPPAPDWEGTYNHHSK